MFNRTSETQEEIAFASVYLDDEDVVFGGFVIRGRPIKKIINDEFKKYCFQSSIVRKQIISKGQGAVRANIGQGDLGKVQLPLPPLIEQKKIATILSTWGKALEKLEKLIVAKENQMKGLMRNLLRGKVRINEFDGEWTNHRLGDLCKMYSGGTPSRKIKKYYQGDIPWIKSGELNQKTVTNVEEKISKEALENSSAKFVEEGTILLALYGATAGVVATTEVKAAINQAVLAIIPNNQVHKKYLFFHLCLRMPKEVERLVQGGQPNLNGGMIKQLKISLPQKEAQIAIAEILSNSENEINVLKLKYKNFENQMKGLMQQLLTGKIRVK